MYFDTAYIAKFYLNEPSSVRVREVVRKADTIYSSLWALPEFHSVLHRHVREGILSLKQARDLSARFDSHVADGLWVLLPVTESLLRLTAQQIQSAPANLFLRTADAVHLITAVEAGETEVWTSGRHMLAAATHFGLNGRSV